MLRNQRLEDEIPHLFAYAQVLMAVSVNEALYGTTMAKAKYWGAWNEEGDIEALVEELADTPLSDAMKERLYDWRDDGQRVRQYFDAQDAAGSRLPTTQDRTMYSSIASGAAAGSGVSVHCV